jgi:hypothetical protein
MMMIGETMTDGTAAGTGIGAGMITMTDAATGMIMMIGTGQSVVNLPIALFFPCFFKRSMHFIMVGGATKQLCGRFMM